MKKISSKTFFAGLGIIFSAVIAIASLSSFTYKHHASEVNVVMRTIEGHKYIIGTTTAASKPGGISIVHAESCQCKHK